ncbi:hypothetical protein ABW21_db0201089 [Orbilia brochopaga]|nr:hypothetical protein ABW21_db0201089 [Drechslerella brochopaga]
MPARPSTRPSRWFCFLLGLGLASIHAMQRKLGPTYAFEVRPLQISPGSTLHGQASCAGLLCQNLSECYQIDDQTFQIDVVSKLCQSIKDNPKMLFIPNPTVVFLAARH